jgi:phenylacetaldehyde dehydrogenase
VPRGTANIVTGRGETVGAALVAHPDVDKVGFTGSTEVGKSIFRSCADRVKRLTLELGGKSPVIVFADADLDAAIGGIARGILSNAGQVCMAGSRVYVQHEVLDQVVHGLTKIASNMLVGSGFDKTSQMGPLISEKHLRRVTRLVERGASTRAEVTCGGRRIEGKGFFFQPTIIREPAFDSEIVREEVFGPVATLTAFDDEQTAVRLANDTEYGLAAAIWTSDLVRAHRMARHIRAGTVWLNCQTVTDRMIPFGGFKQSGLGRESGGEGLDEYLETKAVFFPLECSSPRA